jgi:hypothetical protein
LPARALPEWAFPAEAQYCSGMTQRRSTARAGRPKPSTPVELDDAPLTIASITVASFTNVMRNALRAIPLVRNFGVLVVSVAPRFSRNLHRSCRVASKASRLVSISTLSIVLSIACGMARGTVGARFGRDADGHLYVRDAPPGLGAEKAGIREGDEVILIDGRDVRPLSDDEVHLLLSGERGTEVRFTLLRGDEVVRISVQRTPPPSPVPTK